MKRLEDQKQIEAITNILTQVIAETNGINLLDTLELLLKSDTIANMGQKALFREFQEILIHYQYQTVDINQLLNHPVAKGLFNFFKNFPLRYCEDHIHLTGSLSPDFVHKEIKPLIAKQGTEYWQRIQQIFGEGVVINSTGDLENLLSLGPKEEFDRYLKILDLPALILQDKEVHKRAAYHMAQTLYQKYNVGSLKLKFTFSRVSKDPKIVTTPAKDVVLGLYEGFKSFQSEHTDFNFNLSPSFRKETNYFDTKKFKNKKDDFDNQVKQLLTLLEDYPELNKHLNEVDTVGNERDLYRKGHFRDMREGFRKLQAKGFAIRSHHGEVWHTLSRGIQAVDNAMNIWQINNLEHGLSLGINPNYYFHSLYQRVIDKNQKGIAVANESREYREIVEMDWASDSDSRDALIKGQKLNVNQIRKFTKAKFRTATEIERYQHDVLNRMIQKKISLVALPSSNKRLTGNFTDYKDHPFSWWEKKGVALGVGTDNYITLKTNYIKEMLILLFSDPDNLKITKLLMVTTGEKRRPYVSNLLWQQAKKTRAKNIG